MSTRRKIEEYTSILRKMTDKLSKNHREECRLANKLMDKPKRESIRSLYKVKTEGNTYLVSAEGNAHPAIIQKLIEDYENLSFDQIKWRYLRPQDIFPISAGEMIVTNKRVMESLYYILAGYPITGVIYCNQ
jgi:hypothetical protein